VDLSQVAATGLLMTPADESAPHVLDRYCRRALDVLI
jgi:hypothetical protein